MSNRNDQSTVPGSFLPVPKQPFLPNDRFRIRRIGHPDGLGFSVYLFYDVAEEILYAAQYRTAQTNAGVLTGGYYRGPAGPFVEVRGFQSSVVVESALDFAEHLKKHLRSIHEDPALVEVGQLPVGWFLSRPGCGAKPGPFELIVHLSYFNLPYHLCLLLDPQESLAGLYCHAGDTRIRNIGFNLIEPAQPIEEQAHEDHPGESS